MSGLLFSGLRFCQRSEVEANPNEEEERLKLLRKNFLVVYYFAVLIASFSAMSFAREILVPMFYEHQVGGNIGGDPQLYIELALKKASEVKSNGIGAFELRPDGQGPAGIASLLFLVTENEYIFVFLNSVLLTCSTLFLILTLRNWFSAEISVVASLPLSISPHMFVWFSQLNKDSFVLTGQIMIIYAVSSIIINSWDSNSLSKYGKYVIAGAIGAWVVSIPRPYLNQINFAVISPVLLSIFLFLVVRRIRPAHILRFTVSALVVLASLQLNSKGGASNETLNGFYNFESEKFLSMKSDMVPSVSTDCFIRFAEWQKLSWMPSFVDNKLKAMIGHRCNVFVTLLTHHNSATQYSIVDTDILPNSTITGLMYLPRGVLIGILSPFPVYWLYNVNNPWSFFYTIVPMETFLLYIGLLALFLWLLVYRRWSILIPTLLSFMIMGIYGTAVPFIGGLYRFRYPLWMLLICLGLAATITIIVNANTIKIRHLVGVSSGKMPLRS